MRTFARFATAGAVGYVVNLAVYGAAVHGARIDFRVAATMAFCAALTATFALNRRYTFEAAQAAWSRQAPRYVLVCVVGFAVNVLALQLLVGSGVTKVLAQAIAIGVATPVNFAGQRLFTFADDRPAQPA